MRGAIVIALVAGCGWAGEIEDTADRIMALADKEPLIARADTLNRAAALLAPKHSELARRFTAEASCIGAAGVAPRFDMGDVPADADRVRRLVQQVEEHGDDPAAYEVLAQVIRKEQLSAGLDNPSIRARIALADLDEWLDPILTALDGSEVRLSRYESKKVLLAFWATWCVPCRKELEELEKQSNSSSGPTILAITWEARDVVAQFLREHPYKLLVYIDRGHKLADRFHVDKVPATVFME